MIFTDSTNKRHGAETHAILFSREWPRRVRAGEGALAGGRAPLPSACALCIFPYVKQERALASLAIPGILGRDAIPGILDIPASLAIRGTVAIAGPAPNSFDLMKL